MKSETLVVGGGIWMKMADDPQYHPDCARLLGSIKAVTFMGKALRPIGRPTRVLEMPAAGKVVAAPVRVHQSIIGPLETPLGAGYGWVGQGLEVVFCLLAPVEPAVSMLAEARMVRQGQHMSTRARYPWEFMPRAGLSSMLAQLFTDMLRTIAREV